MSNFKIHFWKDFVFYYLKKYYPTLLMRNKNMNCIYSINYVCRESQNRSFIIVSFSSFIKTAPPLRLSLTKLPAADGSTHYRAGTPTCPSHVPSWSRPARAHYLLAGTETRRQQVLNWFFDAARFQDPWKNWLYPKRDWPRQPKPDGRIYNNRTAQNKQPDSQPNGRIWPYGQKLKYSISYIIYHS